MSSDELRDLRIHDHPETEVDPGATEFRGHRVINEQGEKIGVVTDVIYDPQTNEPTWVVVDAGLLHADHYMPLVGSYRSVEGNLVASFDKATVKHAAKAPKDHVMTRELERELCAHYGLAT
jgi:uncharacterized protein YrrD